MKNKKWLDNFGKADNANDSNVSLPKGFVSLGYNTKGRNYSPAWGGQFEQGGIIPIAQNGVSEYMNKKMQEKKDATIAKDYDLPEVVVSAPIMTKYNDPDKLTGYPQYEPKSNDIAEFYKSWVSSPEYERRMRNTGYYETPMYNSSRQSSINLPKGKSTIYLSPSEFLEDVRGERMSLLESTQAPGFIEYDPNYKSEYRWSGINLNPKDITTPERKQSVLAHEIAHAIDTTTPYENELISGTMFPTDAFNKQFYSQYSEVNPVTGEPILSSEGWGKREKAAYVKNDPQEFKSDLNALRYLMFDKGIYDIRKGKEFTKEDLERAKEVLKGNESLERSLDAAGESGFIKLMNVIAKGKEDVTPVAMGGMSIPGSVGFTYARTAGAAPSKGKYAKKTMASAQGGKQVQKGVDSTLENIFEIFDPTGASSWDDVYQSYQKSGMSPETKFEIFGALPILGKVGKAGKLLRPLLTAGQANKRIKTNANVVSNVLQSIPYVGRGTDATQAIQQVSSVPFFPSAPPAEVGQFGMYAGMPAFNKKEYGGEIPSAQSGIMTPMLLGRKILSYLYPSGEDASTVAAAPVEYKKGLTDELLKRQAYKESTFNPSAVSPAGYKGLTQIGEEVLTDYSKKKGGKKLDPFNPKDAVELQKFAMDDLYNASFINKPNQPDSVRIAKTLAAYNWGRGNLFNYLNEQKQKGVDIYGSYDWLNDLPKETSDYVNKILLQEDESFNKNYKKDSTNPKYKDVTSLYDKKKFGGKVTTAQNGQEMKFYQNGLDWKPKSMQEGGKIYEGQELPEFVVEGKDERIKEAMSQGINKFYGHVGELMGAPQKEMMQLITGKEQTPSEAFGFQNTGGWLDNYSSFGKNLSNLAMDAVLDPVNLIGVGIADDIARTTLKGASKKLASSADDVSKSFKSEIDWAKWNPDTPKYPELIKEYNKIEEATKKAGTWMQNPDGSVFKGTPEQFIQQQSSYFKKAYPKGYNEVYRGVSANTSFPNFNESADPGLRGPRGIFTANKELAGNYVFGPQGWQEEKRILTPFDPDNTPGVFELIYPKGKQITRYQNLDDWTNIDLARTPTKEDIKYNIDNIKSQLERRKKITEELSSTEGMSAIADQAKMEIKSQEDRIKQLQKYYDDFDKVINDEAEFNKMKKALGEQTTTDTIAKYIPKTNLRSVTLQDLIDSGQGDVTIVNNRPGNYLKSMVGNVGFFDLKNPNIYKGIVPAGIATSLTFDQQKNGGITKDNQGYWNPNNWGKPVEIDSNNITMEGVNQPLLGISDTGDTKLMKPGKNYKFKGKKVTEFPVAELGINQLDAQPMKKLNQLLNFTNNPDKDNWLDKYN